MKKAPPLSSISLPDGQLLYFPAFFNGSEADDLLTGLVEELVWEQQEVLIYGRRLKSPRLTAWYGDPEARYAYSGLQLEPRPWLGLLVDIKKKLELAGTCRFNSVLANLYRSGSDSMGWHSDDEPELGSQPVIASVSFGARRRFVLRHRQRRELEKVEVTLGHGDVLFMRGTTQEHWQHQIPKTRRPMEVRVNLTYRLIKPIG